ncbi:cytochrome P450 monooxygenase pc-3 [Coprinopsis marcescibilis]|uniref:Cytochrome P450 monooxygenase pc-3 n=1 Tax=Coprinopsis marcescibilis TaxID=230819 RepID=A0A5C3LJ55_COPMA|nr:cytochrome P450 monooxygenase pc-3 [Coprinopsis marcescibilis]
MVELPPGIAYLIRILPNLVVPPATVLVATKVAQGPLELNIPTWAVILASALSLPLAFFAQFAQKTIADSRAAANHAAKLPPCVYDSWPGGIGLLRATLQNFSDGYPGELFNDWVNQYGNLVNFRIMWENRFLTVEPDHIKAILATQFESFEKGPTFQRMMSTILGTGVFNSDGDMFHRGMTRPFFTKDRISHFDIFDRHATDALSQLKERIKAGYPVDIQDLASRFTMDSATEFLFAKDVQSLAAGLPYPHYSPLSELSEAADHPANRFSRAFDEAQRLTALRSRLGVNWPLAEFWKDRVKEQMAIINAFIEPILSAALQRQRESGEVKRMNATIEREVSENESLLDHLINYTDDEKVLRDETLNILLAGRDTTTNSITWSIYMLSQYPDVLERLRQEVLEKVGETRRPTFDDMKDMKYLRAVINETLRLYPAVPFNVRTTNRAVTLQSKSNSGKWFYIPAGSKTAYSVFLMHRRKDIWGPDADKFDPDRFLDERVKKYITPNPFIFVPFNAGPRICLGQQFAYHETSFFLIRLLQQFKNIKHVVEAQPPSSRPPAEWKHDFENGTKAMDDVRIKSYLTMSVMGGCWVTMEEASVSDSV